MGTVRQAPIKMGVLHMERLSNFATIEPPPLARSPCAAACPPGSLSVRRRPMIRQSLPGALALAAFALIVFLTVWYVPDCRSPHRSISIGGVVLVAGCGGAR
jgi:hypothetical protein